MATTNPKKRGRPKKVKPPFPENEEKIYYTEKAIARPYNPLIEQLNNWLEKMK